MVPVAVQNLINAWSVPFYAGWSIMRIFGVAVVLFLLSLIINFFFDKAK